jgi:GNAT superfamily N-acetyltransferase
MADIAALPSSLPSKLRRGLPKYPLPVALIGRLAVDARAKGRSFGRLLLSDAIARIEAVAESVGCFGVIVDAKDEDAVGFYSKYSFSVVDPSEPFPKRMFLPMATIKRGRNIGI